MVVDLRPHDRIGYREELGHLWPGFTVDQLRGWLEEAGVREAVVRPLPPDVEAQGPLLLMAAGSKAAGETRAYTRARDLTTITRGSTR